MTAPSCPACGLQQTLVAPRCARCGAALAALVPPTTPPSGSGEVPGGWQRVKRWLRGQQPAEPPGGAPSR